MENLISNLKKGSYVFATILMLFSLRPDAHSETINITVTDNMFTPADVTASVGDIIRWTWAGSRAHTTTCDGSFPGTSLPDGASPWDNPLNSGTPIFEYEITVEGVYDYACMFHFPDMTGRITAEKPLPVELTDFVATTIKNEVILDWGTGGEINNEKFIIQRINLDECSCDVSGDNVPFVTVGELHGNGNSNEYHRYKFVDRDLKSGRYVYRLKQVDYNSHYMFHLLKDEIVIGIPDGFTLRQNYPNPFNPSTKISFEIPADGTVKISLFDVSGKLAGVLVDENMKAGYQSFEFNGSSFPSGAYFYKLDYSTLSYSGTQLKKMILVK